MISNISAIGAQLAPWYFRNATEHNKAVAVEAAKEEVARAKAETGGGGLQLERINFEECLSDQDRAILERMYLDAKAKGLPTDQVDEIAMNLSTDKYMAELSNRQGPSLNEAYLQRLINEIHIPGSSRQWLQPSVVQTFLDNFGAYVTQQYSANSETYSESSLDVRA